MEVIIPKTDIPGAIELKLPEFLDNYIVVVMNQIDKATINEYKRRQAPPGLRVSSKAFGLGRRIPIVNHFMGRRS